MSDKKKNFIIIAALIAVIIGILAISFITPNNTSNNVSTSVEPEEKDDLNSLSNTELSNILKAELDSIMPVIKTRINKIPNTTIGQIKLFGHGEWCGATIEYRETSNASIYDKYRIILKKDSSWSITAHPQLIFSYEDYPDIPKQLIRQVNSL